MTLYRKYRPQFFAEVVDQDIIKNIIQNEISMGKIAHAYLFSGPRGVGKTTLARLIARAINCQNRKKGCYEPCGKCSSCLSIYSGSNLDLIEIDAASNRGINEIRDLKNNIRFVPSKSKYKVFIVDEAHMLTLEAFNALLKSLEEPPKYVIFILATTEKHKLPETVISRCQCFDFKKISEKNLLQKLNIIIKKEGIEVDKEVLQAIVKRADGSSRDAESILGQLISLNLKRITWQEADLVLPRSDFLKVKEFVNLLQAGDLKSIFTLISSLLEQGVDLERFTKDLIEYARQELVQQITVETTRRVVSTQRVVSTNFQADLNFYQSVLAVLIEKLSLYKKDLEIQELPLEMAAVEIFLGCEEQHRKENRTTQKSSNTENRRQVVSANTQQVDRQDDKETKSKKLDIAENQIKSPSKLRFGEALQPKQNHTEAKQPLVSSSIKSSLLLADIQKNWHKVLEAIKEHNNSLPVVLNMCNPCNLSDGVLTLAFKFKLHAEVLKIAKNKEIIEKVVTNIINQKVIIKTTIQQEHNNANDHNMNNNTKKADLQDENFTQDDSIKSIDNILSIFDGHIVKDI